MDGSTVVSVDLIMLNESFSLAILRLMAKYLSNGNNVSFYFVRPSGSGNKRRELDIAPRVRARSPSGAGGRDATNDRFRRATVA